MTDNNANQVASFLTKLAVGLNQLDLTASQQQKEQWLEYLTLLQKWNRGINLVAENDVPKAVTRHLLDSLAIAPYILGNRVIDVGTGAGFPGIPLSILYPEKQFFLLDSNQKKQIFVSYVAKALSLSHVQCLHTRVEAYQPTEKFSTILTRAFSPLAQLLPLTAHLLAPEGRLLAMLGKIQVIDESFPAGYQIEQIPLHIPGEKGERHLAIISRQK